MKNAELIATVNAHLDQIERSVSYQSDEATLRAITGSLRTLLVEDGLLHAWRTSGIGGPMTFIAWKIVPIGDGPVVALSGGGDVIPNVPFSACRGAKVEKTQFDLKAFCHMPRVQVDAVKITTVELVRYIANSMGGIHFSSAGKINKKEKSEILSKIASGEIQSVPLRVGDRNLLHHEILSIAQSLIRSPEVMRLRAWRPEVA